MLQDFLNGVGSGLALLMGLALLALFILWITLPFLVLQLVRTNRALTSEVRRLRLLHEQGRTGEAAGATGPRPERSRGESGDAPPTASEEGHYGE
jgi:hypothetical protein